MPFTSCFVGISATLHRKQRMTVAFAFRNAVHLVDFHVADLELAGETPITDGIVGCLESYARAKSAKIIAAGLPSLLGDRCSTLCPRLWLELDVIPFVIPEENWTGTPWRDKNVDEQADSMARRCIRCFNPSMTPALQIGRHSSVQVDAGGSIRLCGLQDYQRTCSAASWQALMFYVDKLRAAGTRIAFFSATPQGGGVALMRHALVRLSRLLSVDVKWYVPKPRQAVFRITKNIHNILQGAARTQAISDADKSAIIDWVTDNAKRYWLTDGGPLCMPEQGGADIVVIDDPQMIGLIPLIKHVSPKRPVLFRSHIQIRSDLVDSNQSPQAGVWEFIWNFVKNADAFLSHPVPTFVPRTVPRDVVAHLPAATDWLDGLNKTLSARDSQYYMQVFNAECHLHNMPELEWPARNYVIQISRFDPSKGLLTVIDSYGELRRRLDRSDFASPPQLVICGNPSVDDPDGVAAFNETVTHIQLKYSHLKKDIIVVRLEANDQLLNVLIRNARVVLQLSTAEGFEIKVSEALHAGRPVIGTSVGGIPLQISHGVNGYLARAGDWDAVASHLTELFTNAGLYSAMSAAAAAAAEAGQGGDQISTVGNATSWYFLAWKFVADGGMKGNGRRVSDMAREELYANG
ncbi:clock-controlled protein-9 protein [Metarhizium album ARSEF 1941]|uniref:Clock-controlled protein-9 protein n=1 Tax=Metarhizium album (strain ARSEF 1941) TaxID=1081103 RepID=A0A0B2X2D3_METAS|nr:clock-controlled protein-9 protein [Metarhizium album ARSEF 1941]KHO00424.1 clock-controlled protein-9 protein [Metarhizium album ARSEF 1941]